MLLPRGPIQLESQLFPSEISGSCWDPTGETTRPCSKQQASEGPSPWGGTRRVLGTSAILTWAANAPRAAPVHMAASPCSGLTARDSTRRAGQTH